MKQAANLLLLDTLITEMSSGRGMRCISETEPRGITGVWTPVNLFIWWAHPLRKQPYCTLTHISSICRRDSMKHRSHIPTLDGVDTLFFQSSGAVWWRAERASYFIRTYHQYRAPTVRDQQAKHL